MRDGLLGQAVSRSASREGRLRLLLEASDALLAGRLPDREAQLYVGSALRAWLSDPDSSFERHARVTLRGSHKTLRKALEELAIAKTRR